MEFLPELRRGDEGDRMRLIDADDMKKHIEGNNNNGIKTIMEWIDNQPTIEPQRMRGRWIGCDNSDHWKCSVCGTRAAFWFSEESSSEADLDMSEWLSDFCPNCGSYNGGEQDVNC